MLVRVGGVVLLGHEVTEETIGERLVAVRVPAGHVDRNGVLVADVLGERRAGLAVEDHDPHHSLQAEEEIVLPALVEVQGADRARPGLREVRLPDRLRQVARARELREPAALVLVPRERKTLNAFDHYVFAPVSSIRRPMSARSAQCLPPSCHQPSTRRTARSPRCAYTRLTSVISSSPRFDGARPSMMSKTSGG